MPHVPMTEAERRLSELITAAEHGERVIITRHGKTAAEIVACGEARGVRLGDVGDIKRRLGLERIIEAVPEDFDTPLPADVLIRPID